MQKLPKLNKIAVDDQPEKKPEKERDYIPYLIVLVVLLCRHLFDCFGIPAPLITSWQGRWITFAVMILGAKVVFYLEKKDDNAKLSLYYVCACSSFLGLFVSMDYHFWILIFIIFIISITFYIFQSLLTRKK
ncbi:MAG: hypothetical protein LBF88_14215 [Planctomycetaceae bacterium]|jgi:hypothetical protein|nr:hypothetical protein [Planctomycetaceae bacterium]